MRRTFYWYVVATATCTKTAGSFTFELFFGDLSNQVPLKYPFQMSTKIILEACKENGELREFINTILYKNKERGLFVTNRGYMGLHTPLLKTGDVICVFPGCKVQVAMRK